MITGLRIAPFIASLGMFGIARGAAKYLADEQKIDAPDTWLSDMMANSPQPQWLLVAPAVWMMFALAVIMAFVLRRTAFGVHTFAIGSNQDTARLCGVPVERCKVVIYAVCGLFAGLAGVMMFGDLAIGDPTTAMGKELDIIAAVVIGGASLAGGEGRISGSLIGAFIMAFLVNGCTLLGARSYTQEILIGAIIVAAVALDSYRHRRS